MIHYVIGDATAPKVEGFKNIVHVCNNVGGWGRGFVLALSKKWKEPERQYRLWSKGLIENYMPFELGYVQNVWVTDEIYVSNMIAQAGYGPDNKNLHRIEGVPDAKPPIRYEALENCLFSVAMSARRSPKAATIHMPRIGCGLAGGKWDIVEGIINETMQDLDVYVYDLPSS